MQGANQGAADKPLDGNSGKGLRIGIVQARFNADITDALASACLDEFAALGVAANDAEGGARKSFRDVKSYRRRKRWLA